MYLFYPWIQRLLTSQLDLRDNSIKSPAESLCWLFCICFIANVVWAISVFQDLILWTSLWDLTLVGWWTQYCLLLLSFSGWCRAGCTRRSDVKAKFSCTLIKRKVSNDSSITCCILSLYLRMFTFLWFYLQGLFFCDVSWEHRVFGPVLPLSSNYLWGILWVQSSVCISCLVSCICHHPHNENSVLMQFHEMLPCGMGDHSILGSPCTLLMPTSTCVH